MTNNEICRNYRAAKNKPEQIKILADMNCTSVDEIKKILIAGGEAVEQLPKTNRGKKKEEKAGNDEIKPEVEKSEVNILVLPESVTDALEKELEFLDIQIKTTIEKLDLFKAKYSEISAFIKSNGSTRERRVDIHGKEVKM